MQVEKKSHAKITIHINLQGNVKIFLKVSSPMTPLRRNDTLNLETYIPFDRYIRQKLFYSIFH